MENGASLWVLIIEVLPISVAAGFVGARLMRDSRYSRLLKRLNDCERMTADLESSFAGLMESHKRLRSRAGMRELRDERASAKPETKLEARRRLFGNAAGPSFAAIQARLNADHSD